MVKIRERCDGSFSAIIEHDNKEHEVIGETAHCVEAIKMAVARDLWFEIVPFEGCQEDARCCKTCRAY